MKIQDLNIISPESYYDANALYAEIRVYKNVFHIRMSTSLHNQLKRPRHLAFAVYDGRLYLIPQTNDTGFYVWDTGMGKSTPYAKIGLWYMPNTLHPVNGVYGAFLDAECGLYYLDLTSAINEEVNNAE